jgi:hypothetical protein
MSEHDPRGLYGHHPDCPMSRHGDSVLVRTAMHPCNFCDVADKAEKRGQENESHDIYQLNFVFTQEAWDAEVERIKRDALADLRTKVDAITADDILQAMQKHEPDYDGIVHGLTARAMQLLWFAAIKGDSDGLSR